MTNDELLDRQTLDRSQSDKAFSKLVSALRPLVEEKLKSKYKNWEAKVSKSDKYPTNLNDPLCLLWTLNKNWTLFANAFSQQDHCLIGKDLVWDLKEYRNISTHNNPNFTTQDKDEAIDNMIRLLELVVPRRPAIEKAISSISEIAKENLLKKMQIIDNRISPIEAKIDKLDAVEADEAPSSEVTVNANDERHSSDQKTQTEDQLSTLSSQITKKLTEGQEKLDAMVFGAGALAITSVIDSTTKISPAVKPPAPFTGTFRVAVEPPNDKSKKFMLQIYDTDGTYIGSYETSSSEVQALKKEPEIYCAQAELRAAFQKNGNQPIVVEWNNENKEKRIKTKRGMGIILGTIPEHCWWTKNKL